MSSYAPEQFLANLLQALEDTLEDALGVEGMVALAIQVARRMRKLSEEFFARMEHIEIPDFAEFIKNTSKALCEKLGLHMEINVKKEDSTYEVITRLKEKHGTAAVFIPLTIVALALEEARQRAEKSFVITDAEVHNDTLVFRLKPVA